MTYRVNAAPAAKTSAPIEAVYLFDSGYLLECKTKPPFEFAVECTQKYFEGTDFMRPGRQRIKPHFDGTHALVAFAQDANGKINAKYSVPIGMTCEYK
jgi:CDGSH-type Zn-finger protein